MVKTITIEGYDRLYNIPMNPPITMELKEPPYNYIAVIGRDIEVRIRLDAKD